MSIIWKRGSKIDYKNVRLLKKYVSENGKILPSRITSVSLKKQRELSLSIKRARNLALIEVCYENCSIRKSEKIRKYKVR